MCDFSGVTISNYKGLSGKTPGGNLPSPNQTWCTASTLHLYRVLQSRTQAPLVCEVFMHICIPSQSTLIPRTLYLRPLAEVSLQVSAEASLWGEVEETLSILPYSESVRRTFPLLVSLPHLIYDLRVHKTAGDFCSGLLKH